MRRQLYGENEQDLLQKLKRENAKLKTEIAKLRKQIARLDLDRFANFRETLDRLDEIEMEQAIKRRDRQVSTDKWKCWTCKQGYLKLVVFERRDGVYYFRKCESCSKRTKLKRYTSAVEV